MAEKSQGIKGGAPFDYDWTKSPYCLYIEITMVRASDLLLREPIRTLGDSVPPTIYGTHNVHALSCSLDSWADVKAYEEGKIKITTGYPRFVCSEPNTQLHDDQQQSGEGRPLVFVNEDLLRQVVGAIPELINNIILRPINAVPGGVVVAPVAGLSDEISKKVATCLKKWWQHTGLGLSSRAAQAVNEGETVKFGNTPAHEVIEQKLSKVYGVPQDFCF